MIHNKTIPIPMVFQRVGGWEMKCQSSNKLNENKADQLKPSTCTGKGHTPVKSAHGLGTSSSCKKHKDQQCMAQFVLPHNLGLRRCVGITNVSQSLKPSIQPRSGLVQKPTTHYLHVLNKLKAHNNVTFHVVHMLLIMHRTVHLRNNDP